MGVKEFDEDVVGTLEVESVDGDRFSGTFELTARSGEADEETVTVKGWIEVARIVCDRKGS